MNVMTASELEIAAKVLRALAHPLRLGIMQELAGGEQTVSDLAERLSASQSMMSQQVRQLVDQGLVKCRKEGTLKYCSVRNSDFLRLFECLKHHLAIFFKV